MRSAPGIFEFWGENLSSAAGVARAIPREVAVVALTQPGPGGPATILLVEDLAFVRDVMAEVLETAGYRLLVTKSPLEALAVCGRDGSAIDLLIADVILPGMSGHEVAFQFMSRFPCGRVLMMSGDVERLGSDARVDGSVDLAKPFAAETLLQKVRWALERDRSSAGGVACRRAMTAAKPDSGKSNGDSGKIGLGV